MSRNIAALYLISAILVLGFCAPSKQIKVFTGSTMGTTYTVKVFDDSDISKQDIDDKLKQLNQIFSTWDKKSELSLFNQQQTDRWIKVSNDLFYVLQVAKQIYQETDGYFDPGVGSLVNLWGFGADKPTHSPSQATVQKMLGDNSIRHLTLQDGANKLVRKTKNIHIDLSAIAKGYAVDVVAKLLNTSNYLVEIGGEVRSSGSKNAKAWTLGIEHPDNAKPITITLNNKSVATSGNYRNYFMLQNKRHAHILNPHNGLPASNDLASVSVVHPQTLYADAYATAMMAMGSQKAIALAKRLRLSVILILDKQASGKVVKINL